VLAEHGQYAGFRPAQRGRIAEPGDPVAGSAAIAALDPDADVYRIRPTQGLSIADPAAGLRPSESPRANVAAAAPGTHGARRGRLYGRDAIDHGSSVRRLAHVRAP